MEVGCPGLGRDRACLLRFDEGTTREWPHGSRLTRRPFDADVSKYRRFRAPGNLFCTEQLGAQAIRRPSSVEYPIRAMTSYVLAGGLALRKSVVTSASSHSSRVARKRANQ